MSTRFIAKLNPAARTGSHAGIGVDPATDRFAVNPDGTVKSIGYCGYAKDLTATTTLTAADSGATLFLNSATEFATTLPAVAAGLRFTFIVKAAPSGASYTVVTASSANVL